MNEENRKKIVDRVIETIIDGDEDLILDTVKEALDDGMTPQSIIEETIRPAADIVGQKFEEGEYFLPELVMCADTMTIAINHLEPMIAKESEGTDKKKEKVVIGSVQGDVHDLGKNIVRSSLIAAGYEVIDLGIDVSTEDFVEAVKKEKPAVLSLGSYMSTTNLEFGIIIEALKKEDLRDGVKVIVGGAAVTDKTSKDQGADGYAPNASETVRVINEWVQE